MTLPEVIQKHKIDNGLIPGESSGGYLGAYTSSTKPTLTSSDAGKFIYLSDTKGWIFWNGEQWSNEL